MDPVRFDDWHEPWLEVAAPFISQRVLLGMGLGALMILWVCVVKWRASRLRLHDKLSQLAHEERQDKFYTGALQLLQERWVPECDEQALIHELEIMVSDEPVREQIRLWYERAFWVRFARHTVDYETFVCDRKFFGTLVQELTTIKNKQRS